MPSSHPRRKTPIPTTQNHDTTTTTTAHQQQIVVGEGGGGWWWVLVLVGAWVNGGGGGGGGLCTTTAQATGEREDRSPFSSLQLGPPPLPSSTNSALLPTRAAEDVRPK